MYLTKFINFKL